MQLYNTILFFVIFKLLFDKKIYKRKILYVNTKLKKKLFFIMSKKKNFFKFILLFNEEVIYFKNIKKKFFKKLHWRVKRRVVKIYLKKLILFFIIKIKIFALFKKTDKIYLSFKFVKKNPINKIKRRRKFRVNFIRWYFFIIFRKLLRKKLNFNNKSFFNKSHSKINEKLKKLRRK